MFPSNTTGVSCPGCQPNDFPVPHICGAGQYRSQWDEHFIAPDPAHAPYYTPPAPPATACEHCWCIEENYSSRLINGQFITSAKPHDVCCACGSRRLKVKAPAEDAG